MTIFGTQEEIEAGIRINWADELAGQDLELSFRDVPFEQLFPPSKM
ncbi:MAG TPA: hypothetical protein VHX38_17275 [Pseudonocardiaceae bacterium]|nr:hypothetical protein [Pseudonocardiaceae bacterium]